MDIPEMRGGGNVSVYTLKRAGESCAECARICVSRMIFVVDGMRV